MLKGTTPNRATICNVRNRESFLLMKQVAGILVSSIHSLFNQKIEGGNLRAGSSQANCPNSHPQQYHYYSRLPSNSSFTSLRNLAVSSQHLNSGIDQLWYRTTGIDGQRGLACARSLGRYPRHTQWNLQFPRHSGRPEFPPSLG